MNAVIVTIGDELLIGQVVNTNAAFIAGRLSDAGVRILRIVTVGDHKMDIDRGLREAFTEADVVIMTGGLGPTHDDVTKRAVADFFSLPLVHDPALKGRIASLLGSRGIAWNDAAQEQTMVPSGAAILPNRYGTAGGILIERTGKMVLALPGVPYEMEQIITDSVVPLLSAKLTGTIAVHRTLRTAGITESALAARLNVPASLPPGVTLAFLPSLSGVRLRLDATGPSRDDAGRSITAAEALIRERGGRYVYGAENDELEDVVGTMLSASGRTLSCAESCTGGAIAKKLTSVPGSSSYFLGSVVAYDNRLKVQLLGVAPSLLATHGAVSRETSLAMASGVRLVTGSDIGISVTGIAGPSGGSPEKPVGTVWIACADSEGSVALKHTFGEGRERVVERAAVAALDLLRRRLLRLE
ncbi:MAG TPA: competence/damage-inducible protein A [Bacteroidota bacterium]|nr:competence/damage-inducible protein A [Bacteroidota bacterium]